MYRMPVKHLEYFLTAILLTSRVKGQHSSFFRRASIFNARKDSVMSGVMDWLYLSPLLAGGTAGIVVDTTLFPLDTIRTRLQSPQGLLKAGGFRGLYKGIGPAFLGSAPTAALFFSSYEFIKRELDLKLNHESQTLVHMVAAANAEVISCLAKVPTEILKQRRQVGLYSNILKAFQTIYRDEGICGFYRGLSSTILREIPFSIIQFPIWEALKVNATSWKGETLNVKEKALCGAVAGGIAAGFTTPIDVAKTRIMLSQNTLSNRLRLHRVLKEIYIERGVLGLFAGFVPRVLWITLGGAIFFGSYELCIDICSSVYKKSVHE